MTHPALEVLVKAVAEEVATMLKPELARLSEHQVQPVLLTVKQAAVYLGLKDVASSEDRDKGVVTLGGHVALDSDKAQAESLAKALAGNEVVANQIAVIPVGAEKDAKAMNVDLDKGIEGTSMPLSSRPSLSRNVKYGVKNRVVTLTGDVDSETKRAHSQQIASSVPNVDQVVNQLQVKGQKASSSN